RELSFGTDLRCALLVGGESMDNQFSLLATNPDIIVATPGRLMHLIIEANLDLKSVEYVVFDEADRLFEMGFADQLKEILHKLPKHRQTHLFSATLPKSIVEFAKAGLTDPILVRLDVESKLSEDLELFFLNTKIEFKDAALLFLLTRVIPDHESTIVFAATKHHVEYLYELLLEKNIKSVFVHGSMDQDARTLSVNKFRKGLNKVMIVTDLAARGIDIPALDNVINYDFTHSEKVFVHRVGRVARNGKRGKAYSLLASDEISYLIDLQLFLGKEWIPLFSRPDAGVEFSYSKQIVFGEIPQTLLDIEHETVLRLRKDKAGVQSLYNVQQNAYKLYRKTRTSSSNESHLRTKEILEQGLATHPILEKYLPQAEIERIDFLSSIKNYRPSQTVFETDKKPTDPTNILMKKRRNILSDKIDGHHKKLKIVETQNKESIKSFKDEEFYIPFEPKDKKSESAYSLTNGCFAEEAQKSLFDLGMGDDRDALNMQTKKLTWDKKKKKFIKQTIGSDNKKRIKTDSGMSVPASFKTDAYERWTKKNNVQLPKIGESELKDFSFQRKGRNQKFNNNNSTKTNDNNGKVKSELKSKDKILKERRLKEKRREKNARPSKKGKKPRK
ncbi:P-loop containing nucleoside triphosphate hydrolase protein, partial [Rozella allomycis CSF55]